MAAQSVRRLRWLSIVIVAAGCVGVGGYVVWNYETVQTHYYRDFGTRNGVPFGIEQIDEETARHRAVIYAVTEQYGRVLAMRRENGHHALNPLQDGTYQEAWDNGAAEWRVQYAGEMTKVALYDSLEKYIGEVVYEALEDGSSLVSFDDHKVPIIVDPDDPASIAPLFSGEINRRPSIVRDRVYFSRDGYIAKRVHETNWGGPVYDSDGIYGRTFRYNSDGQITEIDNIDPEGNIAPDHDGISSIRLQYSDGGDLEGRNWLDGAGERVEDRDGVAAIRTTFDQFGNEVEVSYFDRSMKPLAATFKTRIGYDDWGNAVSESYSDPRGRPATNDLGVSHIERKFDDTGRVLNERYFDAQHRPCERRDQSVFGTALRYDPRGNLIERSYIGADGKLANRNDWRVAREVRQYDEHNRLVEFSYYDANNLQSWRADILLSDIVIRYDERGNVIEESFFANTGQLAITSLGLSGITRQYDAHNNIVDESYSCCGRRPILRKDIGIARASVRYDRDDRVIEIRYYGVDGAPILLPSTGVAGVSYSYDTRGNEAEEQYVGVNGSPAPRSDNGIARVQFRYDDWGYIVGEAYFGADGKPIARGGSPCFNVMGGSYGNGTSLPCFGADVEDLTHSAMGVARTSFRYDRRHREIEEAYFGIDGQPTLRTDLGVARVVWNYRNDGPEVEEHYFGLDSKPLDTKLGYAWKVTSYDGTGVWLGDAYYSAAGLLVDSFKIYDAPSALQFFAETSDTSAKPTCKIRAEPTSLVGSGDVKLFWDSTHSTAGWIYGMDWLAGPAGDVPVYGVSRTSTFIASFVNTSSGVGRQCSAIVTVATKH